MAIDLTKPYAHLALNIVHALNSFNWITAHDQFHNFIPFDKELTDLVEHFDHLNAWSWYEVGMALVSLEEPDKLELKRRIRQTPNEVTLGLHDFLEEGMTKQPQFAAHLPPRVFPSQFYSILRYAYISSILPPDKLDQLLRTDDVDSLRVMLKSNDFPITIRRNDKSTLLHGAAQYHAVAIMQFLLEQQQLDIDSRNQHHYTPLMTAIHSGDVEIARMLVAHGAQIHKKPHRHIRLLDIAYFSHNQAMVDYVKGLFPQTVTRTPDLHELVFWMETQQEDRIIAALKSGELPHVVRDDHKQEVHVLELAINNYLLYVVRYFIENFPLLNSPFPNRKINPVMVAVREKAVTILDYLLSQGAILDMPVDHPTPSSMVLEYLGEERFFHYVQHGLVLHKDETSIGFYASYHGSLPLMTWYFEHGYDMSIVRKDGVSFLTNALMHHHEEVIDFLLLHTPAAVINEKKSPVIAYAVEHSSCDRVKQLVESGFSMEIPARHGLGYRPLHIAVVKKQVDCVRYLLAQGADFKKPSKQMIFVYDLARQTKQPEIVQLLKITYHATGFLRWYAWFVGILILILASLIGIGFLMDYWLG